VAATVAPAPEPIAEPDPPSSSPPPAAAPSAAPAADATTPAPAASPAPPAGDVATLWADTVLPSLSGLTKAMYQSATLASVEGNVAVVQVENDHHRQNCDRKRPDVERALTEALGRAVTVRLEVDGDGGTVAAGAPGTGSGAPTTAPVSDDPEEHLAGHDVHDLPDAPDAPAGGIAALTEAFPGAELIDE
jgi:hypothetical protein